MQQRRDPTAPFSIRPAGSAAFEILDDTGTVIAWATSAWMAQLIAALLTKADQEGLTD